MSSNGFCSPRSDCFPAGLRVLVVDDDPTWVKILEKMLRKCNYEVTTCNLALEALNLLRERKDGFDIVISDVNMPDMDGFKLLEHVGLEMDLPVIMMSVDGETSRVMKGVQHGACDYLLKPIRMKELRNIWQHVLRKRIHEVRDIEGHESLEEIQRAKNGTEYSDESYLFGGDMLSGKKRKDAESKNDNRGESSSVKKSRVIWSSELHKQFVAVVNQIGLDKVGPKKILDLMGLPWLTRENVASHLQKYRLYLSRLEKDEELQAALGEVKHSNLRSKDPPANVFLLDSVSKNTNTLKRKTSINESHALAHKTVMHKNASKIREGSIKGNMVYGDVIDPPSKGTSEIGFGRSSGQIHSEVKFESKTQTQYSWRAHAAPVQYHQEQNPHFQSENMFDHLQPHVHQIQVNSVQNNVTCKPSPLNIEINKPSISSMNPYHGNNRSLMVEKVTTVESTAAMFSVQPQNNLTNCNGFEQIPCSIWGTKSQSSEHDLFDDLTSYQRLGTQSTWQMWGEESNSFTSPDDFPPFDDNLVGFESFGCNNQDQFDDVPPHLFEALMFDHDCSSAPIEYPVIDQGLYII